MGKLKFTENEAVQKAKARRAKILQAVRSSSWNDSNLGRAIQLGDTGSIEACLKRIAERDCDDQAQAKYMLAYIELL